MYIQYNALAFVMQRLIQIVRNSLTSFITVSNMMTCGFKFYFNFRTQPADDQRAYAVFLTVVHSIAECRCNYVISG